MLVSPISNLNPEQGEVQTPNVPANYIVGNPVKTMYMRGGKASIALRNRLVRSAAAALSDLSHMNEMSGL